MAAVPAQARVSAMGVAIEIRGHRYRFASEDDLQAGIAGSLAAFPLEREVRLSPRDRVDLLVDGRIGVEVKIAGGVAAVRRQLIRYAMHDRVEGLVLVTTRSTHTDLPASLAGVPLEVVYLGGAAF